MSHLLYAAAIQRRGGPRHPPIYRRGPVWPGGVHVRASAQAGQVSPARRRMAPAAIGQAPSGVCSNALAQPHTHRLRKLRPGFSWQPGRFREAPQERRSCNWCHVAARLPRYKKGPRRNGTPHRGPVWPAAEGACPGHTFLLSQILPPSALAPVEAIQNRHNTETPFAY